MVSTIKALVVGGLLALMGVLAVNLGVVSFNMPDFVPDFPRVANAQETTVKVVEPARIVRVEAIALDCRSRVHAVVSVEGVRTHSLAGVTYRTDTVAVQATGDVDTCVDADQVTITENPDGTFHVEIPGEAVQFVRPRVDMVASAQSVDYDKGFLGELTDLIPGVDDGDNLIAGAFAHAQQVIGGRACMTEAFAVTSQALEQAYFDQMVAQGVDPGQVSVDIGEPDFDQNPPLDEIGGATFEVEDNGIRCTMSAGAHAGASPGWEDLADNL